MAITYRLCHRFDLPPPPDPLSLDPADPRCGLLHPETPVSQVYNQIQMLFLVYLLIVLPYRTGRKR